MSLEDKLYPFLRVYEAAPQPVKSVVGRAYRALPSRLRHGRAYERFQREAAASESWTPEDMAKYQLQAVKESLLAAYESSFYRERFQAAGVNPAKLESLVQLRDYPLLTKQDLIASREEMVNPRFGASDRLYITTGGSSGVPVGFYLQKGVSRPKEQTYLEAQWSRRGYRVGDKVAVVRGMVTSSKARGGISYYDATRNWLVLSSYHLTPERVGEYVQALNQFRPRHLHMYPSAALLLARLLEQTGKKLDFQPVSVLCGSEKLTLEAQTYLEGVFGASVFHWYGHSERAVLAGQGRQSNLLHFWPGYGYVEFVEPNEEGFQEVIGTTFHNHVMPLVRYRTGDYVKLAPAGSGEWLWPAVEAVAGREHEFLVSATGRQISLTAINMHDRIFDGLCAVQFYQAVPGRAELRYQIGPGWTGAVGGIHDGVLRKLGDDFELELREVKEVEKTSAGKHKWLVKG
jgi:phenylacetate-CoA ligase